MRTFTPTIIIALAATIKNATLARAVSDLEKKGWTFEVTPPGVIRMRHPQVDTPQGYVDLWDAWEIQKILGGTA